MTSFRFMAIVAGLSPAACAALDSLRPAPPSSDAPTPFAIEHVQTHIDLHPGTRRLTLLNLHGDVRLRVNNQRVLGLYAIVQHIGETPLQGTIDAFENDGQIHLNVRYPDEQRLIAGSDHRYGRIDLAVFVPSDFSIDVRTRDGMLQARGIGGAARLRSASGNIELTAHSDFNIRSDSGDVVVRQLTGRWSSATVTTSGDVFAGVPAFSDIVLHVAGRRITSSQGLPSANVDGDRMHLSATFGRGARAFTIDSEGTVHLMPVMSDDVN